MGIETRYRVVGAVLDTKRAIGKMPRMFKDGELLPADFPADIIKALVASGHAEEVTAKEGVIVAKSLPLVKARGKWFHNPRDLQGLTLGQLNAKIAEIDPAVPAFNKKAEAVRWLSQDWEHLA